MNFHNWIENTEIPDVVYHGPGQEFDAFKPATSKTWDGGIWFSDSEAIARGYGTRMDVFTPTVILAKIRINKPFVQYNREKPITDEFMEELRARGYDGVIRLLDSEREFCVFDKDQVQILGKRKETYEQFRQRNEWLVESSLTDLYNSAVDAFPHTRMRQHATNPIKIIHLTWIPFKGMKTLFVKGIARNEDREYTPMILFKKVQYKDKGGVALIDNNGTKHFLEQLSFGNNDVRVRCQCKDFYWRFNYYDWVDASLYGTKRSEYQSHGGPPANPMEMPGMCKHLMKMMKVLQESGIVQ